MVAVVACVSGTRHIRACGHIEVVVLRHRARWRGRRRRCWCCRRCSYISRVVCRQLCRQDRDRVSGGGSYKGGTGDKVAKVGDIRVEKDSTARNASAGPTRQHALRDACPSAKVKKACYSAFGVGRHSRG